MSDIINKVRRTIGLGPNENELYRRAFEKSSRYAFHEAVDYFKEAADRFAEKGDQEWADRAEANALLYQYVGSEKSNTLSSLLQALSKLQHIERIGIQTEMMPIEPLRLELQCRQVEKQIAQTSKDDIWQLCKLHLDASNAFRAMGRYPLLTYEYKKSGDGHDGSAAERYHYHYGMYQFYEALLAKDRDPDAATNHLVLARAAFHNCNDQSRWQVVTELFEKWSTKRICWFCGREVQGAELHFFMCKATVTPYTQQLLETAGHDTSMIDITNSKVAVCTSCLSIISFKAIEEAEKVRQDLSRQLQEARDEVQTLKTRLSQLEQRMNRP